MTDPHRLADAARGVARGCAWLFGGTIAVLGTARAGVTVLAQAPAPADPSVPYGGAMLVAAAVVWALSKVVDTALSGWQRKLAIDKDSDHGKFTRCEETLTLERADRVAERARYVAQMADQAKGWDDRAKSYEDRLKVTGEAFEWVKDQLGAQKVLIAEKDRIIVAQNETLKSLAAQSVRNTSEAIAKINPAPPPSGDSIPVVVTNSPEHPVPTTPAAPDAPTPVKS